MMSPAAQIAMDEWRLWRRSRVAWACLALFGFLIALSSLLTALRMEEARHTRDTQQRAAEQRFREQPARHPHRMVHYGHYVFRTPLPLALLDPGVDAVTGQSLFLEGHRQNTDMFADARAAPNVGGLGRIDPALAYQILAPLLLIALGHGALVRERESRTLPALLAQGVSGPSLYAGKLLALAGVVGVVLVPAGALGFVALQRGEAMLPASLIVGVHGAYLLLWVALIGLVGLVAKRRGTALAVLILVWLAWALWLPRMAVSYAEAVAPADGKLHSDLRMLTEQRALGDGHNANDPAFAALRDGLLAQYGVQRLEDLPVNFRGVVASHAEARLTAVLNAYAEQRMASERDQLARMSQVAWLSPTLATAIASRTLAGTGLDGHHRFLREAEALRFAFVQDLNAAHAHTLSYVDDVRRSSDAAAERRTRIDPQHWQQLDAFVFTPEPAAVRARSALGHAAPLLFWLAMLVIAGFGLARRMQP